ncbi:hypothetical protein [Kitasatospora sp. NPDC004272]
MPEPHPAGPDGPAVDEPAVPAGAGAAAEGTAADGAGADGADTAGSPGPLRFYVELPPGLELLNANQRLHRMQKAKLISALREAARVAAGVACVPALQRAHVFYIVRPDGPRRRRDPGNWAPAAKAAVDGLIDAGVLPDDNSTRLLGPDPRLGAPTPGTQLVLVITDLTRVPAPYLNAFDPTRQLTPNGHRS